jgi:hypothetical protein
MGFEIANDIGSRYNAHREKSILSVGRRELTFGQGALGGLRTAAAEHKQWMENDYNVPMLRLDEEDLLFRLHQDEYEFLSELATERSMRQ